jgi:hypothetical protein
LYKIIFTDFVSLSRVKRGAFCLLPFCWPQIDRFASLWAFSPGNVLMHYRYQQGNNEGFALPFNIYPFITAAYYAGEQHDLPFQNKRS